MENKQKEIIKLEQKLYYIFIELADLEIKNQKESSEYQDKLKQLDSILEEEKKYFKEKLLDSKELETLIQFFKAESKIEYFDKQLTEDDIDRIYIRTSQLLIARKEEISVEIQIKSLIPDSEEITPDTIIKYLWPKHQKLYRKYYNIIFQKKAINYSINDRLYNMEECIKQEKDEYTKADLIQIKYNIAYCDGMFTNEFSKTLPNGPLTKITHEAILIDAHTLKANVSEFMNQISETTFYDAQDFIEELLNTQNNPAYKKALIAELTAVIPYLSKDVLELFETSYKDEKTINEIRLKEIIREELEKRSYYNVAKTEIKPEIQLELNDERIKLIQDIIKIDYSIWKIYEKLSDLKIKSQENTKEYQNWLENLKDAYEIETKYLNQIGNDYDSLLQFSLAINSGNLHLYYDGDIDKIALIDIKTRIGSYLEPILKNLLTDIAYEKYQDNDQEAIKKEKLHNELSKLCKKIFNIQSFKVVSQKIEASEENDKPELIEYQYSFSFSDYHFTRTLLEAKFEGENLPNINPDYLYILSLELGVDYNYLEKEVKEYMEELSTEFILYLEELDEDSEEFKNFCVFKEYQIKAANEIINNETNQKIYNKQKR